jgi:hypothetical protein
MHREDDAFREELADDPAVPRAERSAGAPSRDRARRLRASNMFARLALVISRRSAASSATARRSRD